MSNNEVDRTNEEGMIFNEGFNFGILKSVFPCSVFNQTVVLSGSFWAK